MKAVLISIKPQFCELIAEGKKTVEVRKTKPKMEVPFKVYIYCTKDNTFAEKTLRGFDDQGKAIYYKANKGKVIGEFVCDRITKGNFYLKDTCLTSEEYSAYCPYGAPYAWHITDLVIYDKPRELYDFIDYNKHEVCLKKDCFGGECWCCPNNAIKVRPPQSWCYVEEVSNVYYWHFYNVR